MADTILGEVGFWPRGNWNAETAYSFLSLVAHNGGSYVARRDVPAGTALTDASYWMPISDTRETVRELIEQHPEWVTTVEDGSITAAKLEAGLASKIAQIDRNSARIAEAENEIAGHTTDITALGGRVSLIEAGTTPEGSEVIGIRTGVDGTVYATAGDAVRGQVEDLHDAIEEISEQIEFADVTSGISRTTYGVTVERVGEHTIRMYGTATTGVRLMFMNGQNETKTSASPFSKTLNAGTYKVSIDVSKPGIWSKLNASYGTFASAFQISDGDTVTFANDVMVGYVLTSGTNFGTEDDPTELTVHFTNVSAVDMTARGAIRDLSGDISGLSRALLLSGDARTDLTQGDDLDSLLDIGGYNIPSHTIAISLSNCPTTAAGIVIVGEAHATHIAGNQRLFQAVVGSIPSRIPIYIRYWDGSVWGDWCSVSTVSSQLWTRIAMFGDSITWGRDGNGTAQTQVEWTIPRIVAQKLFADVSNFGVGGMGWASSFYSAATAYDKLVTVGSGLADYNVITMQFGINDSRNPLGSYLDAADATDGGELTIMGQVKKCVDYIYSQNPDAQIIIISPFNNYTSGAAPDWGLNTQKVGGWTLYQLMEEEARFCAHYHIAYIDCLDAPTNYANPTLMYPDGTHPNVDGYKILGRYIAAKIGSITR